MAETFQKQTVPMWIRSDEKDLSGGLFLGVVGVYISSQGILIQDHLGASTRVGI